ncbi:hypothetical protein BH09BAC6_BH09BAC6_33960 [soil metagenome]|jgi:DNA primase
MPSSVVASMKYDPDTAVLRIVYTSGAIYDYLDVPEEVYIAMKTSGSKGVFLNEKLKPNYEFEKVK